MNYTTKYNCSLENALETIDTYGVAVVENILSNEECISLRNKAWNELKTLTSATNKPIDVNDPTTWKTIYDLFPMHSMLLQHFGVGHMQWLWDIRQHENVVNVFSKLWNVKNEELLTSFDGMSVHFPPEKTGRGWFKNEWVHTDQSSFKKGRHCIQGFVTLYDVNDNDATLCVLEKSHKYHEKFFKENEIEEKNDWYKLTNDEQYDYFKVNGCEKVAIKCKAGSIVLWDSRTFHQGIESNKNRKQENFRLIAYVCMTPRNLSSVKDLEKKIKAFRDLRMTTHWPHKPKLFPKTPRTYGKALPEIVEVKTPYLTELGKKLAGF